jgi:AcrR family transcriptional regulator
MPVPEGTRAKLLEAAGEEFAAKGYEAASVREICSRINANVAAVNYHFGSKEELYVATVLEAHRCGMEGMPESFPEHGTAAEQLRAFVHHFLSNVVAISQSGRWHHALMLREMLEPTAAAEVLVNEAIRPRFQRLLGILSRICPEADERRLNALAFSVVGQCLHYKMAGKLASTLLGEQAYESLMDLEFLSDHIASFCLAALGLAPALNAAGEKKAKTKSSTRSL